MDITTLITSLQQTYCSINYYNNIEKVVSIMRRIMSKQTILSSKLFNMSYNILNKFNRRRIVWVGFSIGMRESLTAKPIPVDLEANDFDSTPFIRAMRYTRIFNAKQ